MKTMKKALCLILALVMIAALGVSAWATNTIPNMAVNTHNFLVFQLLTGEPATDEDGNLITDADGNVTKELQTETIAWGSALNTYAKQTAFVNAMKASTVQAVKDAFAAVNIAAEDAEGKDSQKEAQAVAQALYSVKQNASATEWATMAKEIKTALQSTGDAGLRQEAGSTVARDTGYYLLEDEAATDETLKYNLYTHVDDQNPINPKTKDTPDVEKEVKVKDGDEYVKGTEYAVGDTVEFKITATLPEGYENKSDYYMTFTDTQDNAFSKPDNIVVQTIHYTTAEDGTRVPSEPVTVDPSMYAANVTEHGFTIEILRMKDAEVAGNPFINLSDGDEIVITYTATLTSDGLILGGTGNTNKVELDYTGAGDDKPTDTAKVFTFEFDANKVDGSSAEKSPLAGAAFSLYKKIATPENVDELNEPEYLVDRGEDGNAIAVYQLIESFEAGETTTFEFKGLTTGDYRLVEDKAPEGGYNPIDPIDFTLVAEYNSDKTEVTVLKLQKASGNVDGNAANGTVTIDVENFQGVVLPETGGIGTTIFYLGGAVLLLGAVVLLITKRRARFDED